MFSKLGKNSMAVFGERVMRNADLIVPQGVVQYSPNEPTFPSVGRNLEIWGTDVFQFQRHQCALFRSVDDVVREYRLEFDRQFTIGFDRPKCGVYFVVVEHDVVECEITFVTLMDAVFAVSRVAESRPSAGGPFAIGG